MAYVLCINSGSSSIKLALFARDGGGNPVAALRGSIDGIDRAPRLRIRDATGTTLARRDWPEGAQPGHAALLTALLDWLQASRFAGDIRGAGHRITHGGRAFVQPVRVGSAELRELETLSPLAPLHQSHNLAAIHALAARQPALPQVACFDTAFHHAMPEVATRLALPATLHARGIRRYGFHGLSYEYIAGRLRERDPRLAQGRVIVAHLGSGASLCALAAGSSIDTTMGFSALDGLVMGTRCGTLDPGVVLHLQTHLGMSAGQVEELLYTKSGLLGVSGLSGDMRVLAASDSAAALQAIELFGWRAAREAGGMAASLGGLDGIVFTGGIGEHQPPVRSQICRRLHWLGVQLNESANAAGESLISTATSAVSVQVMRTDEEWMIASHTWRVLADLPPEHGDGR